MNESSEKERFFKFREVFTEISEQYNLGLITDREAYFKTVEATFYLSGRDPEKEEG